jgi:hypothetical protein
MSDVQRDVVCRGDPPTLAIRTNTAGKRATRGLPLRAVIAAALYLALATWLAGVRPLWLDEVLQLRDTRRPSPAHRVPYADFLLGIPQTTGRFCSNTRVMPI